MTERELELRQRLERMDREILKRCIKRERIQDALAVELCPYRQGQEMINALGERGYVCGIKWDHFQPHYKVMIKVHIGRRAEEIVRLRDYEEWEALNE